ncbi:hypothetical protein HY501_00960 [Candidatus Woesearchaeota archaeon]|nr:hypothetical protein [Candidatus Woesearchaeota archaeon]
MRKYRAKKQGKIVGLLGAIPGTGSIIYSYNVCHNICLGVVAMLSVFGIAVSSDILMFLQGYTTIFWTAGMLMLLTTLLIYARLRCISTKLIFLNTGLLIAGVPFFPGWQILFWIAGFSVTILVFGLFIVDKMEVRR